MILFFHGCSEDEKVESPDISETEDMLLSYELSVQEKSLAHPIILPGAPGENSKLIDPEAASNIAITTYVDADVNFLQGMIIHHQQAIVMSNMADKRTNNKTIVDLANRIDASQEDEIIFMKNWLNLRDEDISLNHSDHHMHIGMAGMASDSQLKELENSDSTDFDRLFLQLMISHHDGALKMVKDLKEYPGTAYDPILSEFISDLVNDQSVEIERMNGIAVNLSDDPRSKLSPGHYDAGEAILNLEKVASLKKPIGFYNPNNPKSKGIKAKSEEEKYGKKEKTIEDKSRSLRSPILSFANTDMAFRDNVLVAGNYHGFNIYEIDQMGLPVLLSSVVCPGGQGDVSIVDNLLIMSVEQSRSRIDCGLQGVSKEASPDRFRGIRIFDISNLSKPKHVGAVQTCRGSHTHSVVSGPDQKGKIIVYNSGTQGVRDEEELSLIHI